MNATEKALALTPQEFAHLGDGAVAYVKTINSEDVSRLFPQAPPIQPGRQAVRAAGADGSPIMLTDSKDAAIANAWEHELRDGQPALSARGRGRAGLSRADREDKRTDPKSSSKGPPDARLSRSHARRPGQRRGQGRPDRHGVRSLFGRQIRFDLGARLPARHDKAAASQVDRPRTDLVSERRHQHRVSQGAWRLDLGRMGRRNGDLGPVYGKQWRAWEGPEGEPTTRSAGC